MSLIQRLSFYSFLLAWPLAATGPAVADPTLETRDAMSRIGQAVAALYTSAEVLDYCVWSYGTIDRSALPIVDHADLEALVVPDLLDELPMLDAWGHPFEFRGTTGPGIPDIVVLSSGADGVFETMPYSGGYTSSPNDDLVWSDRSFVRQPAVAPSLWRDQAAEAIGEMGTRLMFWRWDQVGGSLPGTSAQSTVDFATANPVDPATLLERLAPAPGFFAYTRCIPQVDPWGTPYEVVDFFEPDQIALPANDVYFGLRSAGSDGVFEGTVYDRRAVSDPAADLVWAGRVPFRFPTLFADGFE